MNKDQLTGRIEKAWQEFKKSIDGLSDKEMLEPGVNGDWSIRDIIAHVTSWEKEALKNLPIIVEGKRTPRYSDLYGGIDSFNKLTIEKARDLSPDEVLAESEKTHQELLAFIQTAPQTQITTETRFRRRIRYDTYSHYPEHTKAILAWRLDVGFHL